MASLNREDRSSWPCVEKQDVHDFVVTSLKALKVKEEFACDLADVIVEADYRGHYSHGLNRLDLYIQDFQHNLMKVDSAAPSVIKETVATAWVDGDTCPGPTVAKFCMNLAIKKAKDVGIGWVVAKASTHFGITGYYSMMASEQGLMGMAYANGSSLVVPTRAKTGNLGTNTISVAAPSTDENSGFVLDMATSVTAANKIRLAERKGQPIPAGWAQDRYGKITTDPTEVLHGGGLLPLGGLEETGGYKGYGLGLMVEMMTSVLGGADIGPFHRSVNDTSRSSNTGQCFVAVNPEMFAPDFNERSHELLSHLRNLEPVDECLPVLVAGDPEKINMEACDKRGGIPYHPNQIQHVNEIADKLGVVRIQIKE